MIPLGVLASRRAATGAGGFAFIGGRPFDGGTVKITTMTGVPLGPEFPGRQVLIAVMLATNGTAGDITSVVVGGVTFTLDVKSGIARSVVGLARGEVAGTAADITVTAGASTNMAYESSAIAVYSLPPGVAPAYSYGGLGTVAAPLTSIPGGISVVAHTRTTDGIASFASPLTTDYNHNLLRLAGHVLDYDGTFDMSPSYTGNAAYNRIAGVTYA